jgi:hypothetical protein
MCNEFASCVLLKNTVTYMGGQCVGKCLNLGGDKCPDWVNECSP